MAEAAPNEKDENGVAYYLIVDDSGEPLMLMASRHPVDTYRLHRDGPPWREMPGLVTYFAGDPDHPFYRLTLAQARTFARRFGGDLMTKEELDQEFRPRRPQDADYDPSDGPLPDRLKASPR